jgi:hypothetical protein
LKRWTESVVSEPIEAAIESIFDRLLTLDFTDRGEPYCLNLDLEAKTAWIAFYNGHAAEQHHATGAEAAAWSKLEGYAARLALLHYLSRCAAGDATAGDTGRIDRASIEAGVTLARWFGGEARRVYALFAETEEDAERRKLAELIEARGGRITASELMHTSRAYQPVERAEAALEELAGAGIGLWEIIPTGGRPRRDFVLRCPGTVTVTESPIAPAENNLSVTVTPEGQENRNKP